MIKLTCPKVNSRRHPSIGPSIGVDFNQIALLVTVLFCREFTATVQCAFKMFSSVSFFWSTAPKSRGIGSNEIDDDGEIPRSSIGVLFSRVLLRVHF